MRSWQQAIFKALVGALFICFAQRLTAAEIVRLAHPIAGVPDVDVITLTGEIMTGDEIKFSTASMAGGKVIVELDSGGGDLDAGLQMGRAIRLKGFATRAPGFCASACALMWLAGSPRLLESTSKIGFHAAYIEKDGKLLEKGMGNALIGAYLNQLGLSDSAIRFVTFAPPEGVLYIDTDTARELGVDTILLEDSNPSSGPRQTADEPYDPISVVKQFYNALSIANGNLAAAVVIPEKRGIGPFNETNIIKFYGDMKEPLKLRTVRRLSDNVVLAEYHWVYKNGRVCNGRAEVTTKYIFGKTLIEGIKADC